jgi:transposase
MDGAVEIITGRERRRRWSIEQKLRVVAETHEPGARISAVAARHGLCEAWCSPGADRRERVC